MYRLQALAPERTQQGCSHQVQKQEETEGANSGQGNFKLCKVFFKKKKSVKLFPIISIQVSAQR
jgi:hypothetical protein